jgi:CBS domain-containing protein
MRCQEIMKQDLESVSPSDTVEDAAQRMRDENIGFLPVCDESRKVVGTLTDRDIAVRVVAARKPASTKVEDVMTREAIACDPRDDMREAEQAMAAHHKSRIMCVDDQGTLVGVISLSDIVRHEGARRATSTLLEVSAREARP